MTAPGAWPAKVAMLVSGLTKAQLLAVAAEDIKHSRRVLRNKEKKKRQRSKGK